MGLYLCVFDSDTADHDLDGVEVGSYDDFGQFRAEIHEQLETGLAYGSRFPTLLRHSDCDGQWSVAECHALLAELETIRGEWASTSPGSYTGWQAEIALQVGHVPTDHSEYYLDVDGENLLDRLTDLARRAIDHGRPVTFM